MSSLFSCLGKKSKSKKKKHGKPPEPKLVEDQPKEEGDKENSIEEDIPADKVNGHLSNDAGECKESAPVECEEDTQQVTLIKELKSKLSVKADKEQDVTKKTESNKDDVKLSETTPEVEPEPELKKEVSEIIESSAIRSVEAEIVKLESKAKEAENQQILKSESTSDTNLKQTNHFLSEQNQNLKKTCQDNEKQISKQKEEINSLQKECFTLKAVIDRQEKLKDIVKEREEVMVAIQQLTDVCSSLQVRLDKVENEKDAKINASVEIESKMSSIDSEHHDIDVRVKNALKSVQELECRVINLELEKENDNDNSEEILMDIKDLELSKNQLEEELNTAVQKGAEQLNKINSLESRIEMLNTTVSKLQTENKEFKDLLEESSKSSRVKDDKISSMQNTETSMQNTIRNIESKLDHYEARHKSESDEIAVLKTKLEKLEGQLREKEIAHQETIRKLAEAQNKQEDLQKRLSLVTTEKVTVSADKVTVNSVAVQPIQPEDSPIKIGEKFRELYSTVWCEAYERLHTVCKRDERKVLLILMEYLTECYLYSRRTARHQMDALLSLLVSPTNMRGSLNKRLQGKNSQIDSIPNALRQNIMAFRRTPSESFTESIFEEFMNQVDYQKSRHLRNIQARDITEVTPFVRKCIGVCWEMVTQEPPMYLLFKLRHNQIIEKDKFDIYNGDGNKVDFLVWPALLRDENGPMLQRGVVQAVRS